MAETSSIDAAISLMAEEVSSAAELKSMALSATPLTERLISSTAVAVSLTDAANASVSLLMLLTELVMLVMEAVTSWAEVDISS